MILPVGISFYTFQSMSYVIDVYRGRHAAGGALSRLRPLRRVLPAARRRADRAHRRTCCRRSCARARPTAERVQIGLTLMIIGFTKKVLIADLARARGRPHLRRTRSG